MSDFSLMQELTLVREVMAAIGNFHRDHNLTANPGAIRDVLLAVAGLLHKEASQLEKPIDLNRLEDSFAEKARERLQDALHASSGDATGSMQ